MSTTISPLEIQVSARLNSRILRFEAFAFVTTPCQPESRI